MIRSQQIMKRLRRLIRRLERAGTASRLELLTLVEAHNYIDEKEVSEMRFKYLTHIDGNPRN